MKPASQPHWIWQPGLWWSLQKQPTKVADLATLLNHKTAEWEAHIPNLGEPERDSLGSNDLQRQGPWATRTRIIWDTCWFKDWTSESEPEVVKTQT